MVDINDLDHITHSQHESAVVTPCADELVHLENCFTDHKPSAKLHPFLHLENCSTGHKTTVMLHPF